MTTKQLAELHTQITKCIADMHNKQWRMHKQIDETAGQMQGKISELGAGLHKHLEHNSAQVEQKLCQVQEKIDVGEKQAETSAEEFKAFLGELAHKFDSSGRDFRAMVEKSGDEQKVLFADLGQKVESSAGKAEDKFTELGSAFGAMNDKVENSGEEQKKHFAELNEKVESQQRETSTTARKIDNLNDKVEKLQSDMTDALAQVAREVRTVAKDVADGMMTERDDISAKIGETCERLSGLEKFMLKAQVTVARSARTVQAASTGSEALAKVAAEMEDEADATAVYEEPCIVLSAG